MAWVWLLSISCHDNHFTELKNIAVIVRSAMFILLWVLLKFSMAIICVWKLTCKMKTITAYQVTFNVHLRSNSVHMCLCGAQKRSWEDTCYHLRSDPENERSCFTRIWPTCTSSLLCKLKSLHDCNWKFKSYVLTQKLLFFSRLLNCFPEHLLEKMFANHWKVSPKTHQWKGNKKLLNLKYWNIVVPTFMVSWCVSQITILLIFHVQT